MKIKIENTKILTMAPDCEGVTRGSLGIDGEKIAWVGEEPAGFAAEEIIDGKGCLVIPGLVNAHTHAPMSLLRNYANDLELMDWLNQSVFPAEDRMDGECGYYGALLTIIELIRSGCTAFEEQYMFADEIARAASDSGIRANVSRGLIGDGADEGSLRRLTENIGLYEKWHGKGDGRIRVDFGPHAPYTCRDGILKKVVETVSDLPEAGIHIHLCETKFEVEQSLKEYGCTPIERMDGLGLFENNRVVAAHCVHVKERDVAILRKHNTHVVHNPSSNLKLASGFAPVSMLLAEGINVALGTDGSSSNNNVDMIEEMHIASLLAKAVAGDAKALPAYEAVKMATVNGAKALGIDHMTGTIEAGKAADLAIIDMSAANWCPHTDLISALAYSMNSRDVRTVICAGKILMKDWKILTIDEELVLKKAEELAGRILK